MYKFIMLYFTLMYVKWNGHNKEIFETQKKKKKKKKKFGLGWAWCFN